MAATTTTCNRRYIALMRHGQSESNLVGHSKSIFDPLLTPKGENDARSARQWLENSYSPIPSIVLTSTLSRALQTSIAAFGDLLDPLASGTPSAGSQSDGESQGGESTTSLFVPVFATDFVREIVGGGCIAETRRPVSELRSTYGSIDFRLIRESECDDPFKQLAIADTGEEGPGERLVALQARAAHVANALWSLPWSSRYETIGIVSHYYFLQKLVEGMIADQPAALQDSLASFLKRWPNGAVLILALDAPLEQPSATMIDGLPTPLDPVTVLHQALNETVPAARRGTISLRCMSVNL
jgi:broad specificity phosphatase PhoE